MKPAHRTDLGSLSRRRFLLWGTLAGGTCGLAGLANQAPDDPTENEGRDFITPEAQRAIDNGLSFLSRTQNRDGSYGDRFQFHGSVAVTSLAGLALMAGGYHP